MECVKNNKLIFLATLVLIILVIFYFYFRNSEHYAPYASILAPDMINSTAGFDFPNQYGETLEPYQKQKDRTENKLFEKTHALSFR